MTQVAVVYHSGYGHTKKQAEAIAKGAQAELIAIDTSGDLTEAQWATLKTADAIIFGSPTYMGTVSWQFKKFADATSKPWFSQQWKDKVFGGFTNSASMNGDKHSTIHYFFTLAMQHSGIWLGTDVLPSNAKTAKRDDINYIGSFAGAMMQTPSDASVDEVNSGDLETARKYGERIAMFTKKMTAAVRS
ncbi:MAG: flavodoxin family protein [Ottowia sp.]|nr:flavodoxin family protein [Ottowia sp.]